MKYGCADRKILCKNNQFSPSKNHIRNQMQKTPCIAALWGRPTTGNFDKESSHVVGISSNAR